MTAQEKLGWDTRAWLVGIIGGVVGGSITAWVSRAAVARHLNAAFHSIDASDWVHGIVTSLAVLVLPGVLSGIARRRTFLWGALPLTLFITIIDAADWAENGPQSVVKDFWVPILIIGGCLLLTSGPVSLFRYRRVRAQRRREATLASLAAQREAASIPQEGVWPPPPDYRPQD